MEENRQYIAIDLKSFYASVECVERGLNPLDACLVVADITRTEKTICLAVSPTLKSFGIGGRPRMFEVIQRLAAVNRQRGKAGSSTSGDELRRRNDLAVDYIVAPPRMALYLKYSNAIYNIYLRYIAPEDIHVYSIDEVFIDATPYLNTYGMTAHELAMTMIREVLDETGITATAGIGSNMYLCKIAMDIMAKKQKPDSDGVRIAELDVMTYRRNLWTHTPLTDFWRVGRGIASRLAAHGLTTMGDIARCSINNEDLLYQLLGINAELLIDHAWGLEPVTMPQVKAYEPETRSICSGQVLTMPYTAAKARIVTLEMADDIALDLTCKELLTNQIILDINYDVDSLADVYIREHYAGRISTDRYGRKVPFHAHGTVNLIRHTSSSSILSTKIGELFDRIVNPLLFIRRITISANRLIHESQLPEIKVKPLQPDLFTDYDELQRLTDAEEAGRARELRRQKAILKIKQTFGKNAILKGLNYEDGATQRSRNKQIGGHHE